MEWKIAKIGVILVVYWSLTNFCKCSCLNNDNHFLAHGFWGQWVTSAWLWPGLLLPQGLTGAGESASKMTLDWKVDVGYWQGTCVPHHVHSPQDSLSVFMTWQVASFRVCDPIGHSGSWNAFYNLDLGVTYLLQVSPDLIGYKGINTRRWGSFDKGGSSWRLATAGVITSLCKI